MTFRKLGTKNEYFALGGCLLVILVVVMIAFCPYGRLRMTYDSQHLIEASRSLETYLTGKNSDGFSNLYRAPVHPFLLSWFDDKMLAMWWVNLLALLGSLFIIFRICRLNDLSIGFSAGAVVATVLSYQWLTNYLFFWTEPVFILLILWLTYALIKGYHVSLIVLLCLLIFLTRTAGIFIFIACGAFYLIERKRTNAALLLAIGTFAFATWQWIQFSYVSTGYLGVTLVHERLYYRIFYLDVITSWFLPMTIPLLFRVIILLSIFIVALYCFRDKIIYHFQKRQNVVLLSIAGIYTAVFVLLKGANGYEDGERYLNVVYPLWLILLASVVAQIVTSGTKNHRIFVTIACGLWLSYTFLRAAHHLT